NAAIDAVKKASEEADKGNTEALAKAVADLNTAIEAVTKATADADKVNADALEKAVADLNAAIEAAKTIASDADKENADALKEAIDKLSAAIEAARKEADDKNAALKNELEQAVTDLNAAIDAVKKASEEADKGNAVALANAVADLKSAIEAAKKAAADENAALKSELEQAISDADKVMTEAAMKLEDWDKATDEIVENALNKLDEKFDNYSPKLYTQDGFDSIAYAYQKAYIKILRATSVERIQEILDAFSAEADAVASITDEIYNKLCDVRSKFDEIDEYIAVEGQTLLDKSAKDMLDEAKSMLDEAKTLIGDALDKNVKEINDEIKSYGEAGIDLTDLYTQYSVRYEQYIAERNKLIQISDGAGIKADMDDALKALITDKTDLTGIREEFDVWISYEDNKLSDVEGFEDTYNAFVAAEERVLMLKEAREEADKINSDIAALDSSIIANGATQTNYTERENIKEAIKTWVEKYFADPYDAELPTENSEGSDNYKMVDHAYFSEVSENYESKVAAFKQAAANFIDAVNAIGEVNLLSGDKINAALVAYNTWVITEKLGNFDYVLEPGKTPADYYGEFSDKRAQYSILRENARSEYETVFGEVDGITVTIYDGEKVSAVLGWYEKYGVYTSEGVIDFGDNGYVLSDTLTVNKADYDAVVKMAADFNTLEQAKKAETAAVIDAINAIGTVSTSRKSAIEAARAAYDAWLNGTAVPEGFAAEQYKIVSDDTTYEITNYDTLLEAEKTLKELTDTIEAIHAAIEALDAKTVSTDFDSVEDRNAYSETIAEIRADIAAFIISNNNDLEGNITDAEEAKLAAGELAIVKYDTVAELRTQAAETRAIVNDVAKTYVDTILENAETAVNGATSDSGIASVSSLAGVKFEAVVASGTVYDGFVSAVNNDTASPDNHTLALVAMEESFANNLDRTVAAEDEAFVQRNVNLVHDELKAICDGYGIVTE
ncbi:MAG: hypothetical protein ACI3XQ_08720, partial [Eubacteriales bacterium]